MFTSCRMLSLSYLSFSFFCDMGIMSTLESHCKGSGGQCKRQRILDKCHFPSFPASTIQHQFRAHCLLHRLSIGLIYCSLDLGRWEWGIASSFCAIDWMFFMKQILVKQRMPALTLVRARMFIESLARVVTGRGMVGLVNARFEQMSVSEPPNLKTSNLGT